MMVAFCHTMSTLVVALGATTTTGPPTCTLPASIECALQTAGVREPEAMTTTLLTAELRTVSDVAELSAAETAELFDDMRAAAVPLGDRSRLRKVAWVDPLRCLGPSAMGRTRRTVGDDVSVRQFADIA